MLAIMIFGMSFVVQSSKCSEFFSMTQISNPVDHTDCPFWDSSSNKLYYVETYSGKLVSYNLANNCVQSIRLNGTVGPIIPSKKKNYFIVGNENAVVGLSWDPCGRMINIKTIFNAGYACPKCRFNDGKATKNGNVMIGTMGKETNPNNVIPPYLGTLYSLSKKGQIPTTVLSPVNISSGMAWNRANDKFYYADRNTYEILEFDFDEQTGALSNRRVVFDLQRNGVKGHPAGMTIDRDDQLWVALYQGGSVIRVDVIFHQLSYVIDMPAWLVTSVAWGGENNDILFVTTSRYNLTSEDILEQPLAGSVFALRNLGTAGFPSNKADIL